MTGTAIAVPRSVAFRRERERTWRSLEALVTRVESRGIGALNAEEIARLPALYRSVLASASVARSISLDRNSVEYLEALATRAYFCVYAAKRRPWDVVRGFLSRGFPAAVRRFAPHVLVAALLLLGGTAAGAALVAHDADLYFSLVPADLADGRDPSASDEELRAVLRGGDDRGDGELGAFAAFLFSHNTRVGLLCFGLGFAAGLPVFWLLFTNGMVLGAMAALYASRGMGVAFWAWVLPHGVPELFALVLCGAGGLALGQAVVFPGRGTRAAVLARAGREAGGLVAGATILLLAAGLLEGFFRQRVHDDGIRLLVAAAGAAGLLLYLGPGRRRP